MKLYATTTSERASKGQGGNEFIEIELRSGSAKNSFLEYTVEYTEEGIRVYDADANILLETGDREKGEKQKGESVEVLSGSEYMVKNDKGEEVIFESVIPKSLSI